MKKIVGINLIVTLTVLATSAALLWSAKILNENGFSHLDWIGWTIVSVSITSVAAIFWWPISSVICSVAAFPFLKKIPIKSDQKWLHLPISFVLNSLVLFPIAFFTVYFSD